MPGRLWQATSESGQLDQAGRVFRTAWALGGSEPEVKQLAARLHAVLWRS